MSEPMMSALFTSTTRGNSPCQHSYGYNKYAQPNLSAHLNYFLDLRSKIPLSLTKEEMTESGNLSTYTRFGCSESDVERGSFLYYC